jgi:hypothetical protein
MPSNPKNTVSTVIPGPRVRILLPPARSQLRTFWLPGASHAGGTQSSNPLWSSGESPTNRARRVPPEGRRLSDDQLTRRREASPMQPTAGFGALLPLDATVTNGKICP